MRVLIVDDEADIRMILRINLERMGHEVQTAPNAMKATPEVTNTNELVQIFSLTGKVNPQR